VGVGKVGARGGRYRHARRKPSGSAQDVPVQVTPLKKRRGRRVREVFANHAIWVAPFHPWFLGGGDGSVYIRGVGSVLSRLDNQSSVAWYADGMCCYSALSRPIWAFNNVERVGSWRARRATLFSRNANGGVINIVTPDPEPEGRLEHEPEDTGTHYGEGKFR